MTLPVFEQFEGDALVYWLMAQNAGTVAQLALHGMLKAHPQDIALDFEVTAEQLPLTLPAQTRATVAQHLKTQAGYVRQQFNIPT